MQISGEIRWFWRQAPAGMDAWFRESTEGWCAAGGGETRFDEYLRDKNQVELGVKRRGGKPGVEVKGLVAKSFAQLTAAPFVGGIEVWTKWTSEALEIEASAAIVVEKLRWLRKFDTIGPIPREIPLDGKERPLDGQALPTLGCNVEFTQVRLPDKEMWWTLGFESFGRIETVGSGLTGTALAMAARRPPNLGTAIVVSYPAWLSELVV